jgi:hypothetical protein
VVEEGIRFVGRRHRLQLQHAERFGRGLGASD